MFAIFLVDYSADHGPSEEIAYLIFNYAFDGVFFVWLCFCS